MTEKLKVLSKLLSSAEMVYGAGDYTSAAILYFKFLFGVSDLAISNLGLLEPKNHTERFKILQYRIPDLYQVLDRFFPLYQTTYTKETSKDACDEVRKSAKELAKNYKIPNSQ